MSNKPFEESLDDPQEEDMTHTQKGTRRQSLEARKQDKNFAQGGNR